MSTVISRLKLDHPDLGEAGGAALHLKVSTLLTKIGDMANARFFTQAALANASFVDFDHNFKCQFADLRFDLFTYDTGTGELTDVNPPTNYVIAATPGLLTTKIRVTNNTGSAKDIAIVVVQDPINFDELTDVTITSPQNGQVPVWNSSTLQWENQNVPDGVGGKLKLWETY